MLLAVKRREQIDNQKERAAFRRVRIAETLFLLLLLAYTLSLLHDQHYSIHGQAKITQNFHIVLFHADYD